MEASRLSVTTFHSVSSRPVDLKHSRVTYPLLYLYRYCFHSTHVNLSASNDIVFEADDISTSILRRLDFRDEKRINNKK